MFKLTAFKRNSIISLVSIFLILIIIGIFFVFDTSSIFAFQAHDNQFHYTIRQLQFIGIGILLTFIISVININKTRKIALLPIIIGIIVLFVTAFFGKEVNGARRWITFGPIDLQFAEIIKPILIYYFGFWIAKGDESGRNIEETYEKRWHYLSHLFIWGAIIGAICLAIYLQQDLGTIFVVCITAIGMLFLGHKSIYMRIGTIFLIIIMTLAISFGLLSSSYRKERFNIYSELFTTGRLSDIEDIRNSGRQIFQSLIAVGSGGVFGKGLGSSGQKYDYIDSEIVFTDAVFPIIAEETGLVGSCILLSIYLYIIYKLFHIADQMRYNRGLANILYGVGIWIGIQAFFHIAVNISLLPFKGLTLPFISYGGSSIFSLFIGLGLVFSAILHYDENNKVEKIV